ncbi:MAG: hypothetical protein ACI4ET_14400 [Bilifractor sp.]
MSEERLFDNPKEARDALYYSIYPDLNGRIWIKFFGIFRYDCNLPSKPWRLQEYFGADFAYEDFLNMSPSELKENLSEIKDTVGNFTDEAVLYSMNHFFTTYCMPPDSRRVVKMPLDQLTDRTPCGLYVT